MTTNLNFLTDLINNHILIITLPEIYTIEDLLDMKVNKNYIDFKLKDKKDFKLKDGKFKLEIKDKNILNFIKNMDTIKNRKLFIIDIEQMKKKNNGVFFIYD